MPTPISRRVRTMIRKRFRSENSTIRCIQLLLATDLLTQENRFQLKTAIGDHRLAGFQATLDFNAVSVDSACLDVSLNELRLTDLHENDGPVIDGLERSLGRHDRVPAGRRGNQERRKHVDLE